MTRRPCALRTAVLALALLFGSALRGRAQSAEGYTDILYDEFNDQMLAFAITTADYDTLYYYVPHVHVMFMKEHDYYPYNVALGENDGTGGEIFDYALASVSAPVEAGVPYSAFADHSIDIYFYDEWNYGWYDYYGYGLLELPYPWDLPRFEVWVWVAPIITAIQYLQSLNLGQTAKEAFFAPPPTLSCPGSVTRGTNVTCTVSGVAEGQVLGWSFSGDDQSGNVTGPSGVTHWSGTMVQSGTVSVTLSAGLPPPDPKHITVNNRSWLSAPPSSDQVAEGTSVDCSPGLLFEPYPQEASLLGGACPYAYFNVTPATVSGGPNDGLLFVMSANHAGSYFKWAEYSALQNSNSDFYMAQCGNWVPPTGPGFTSGATLKANVERHEGGSNPSHYAFFYSAWTDSSLNPEAVAEAQVAQGGSQEDFRQGVLTLLSQKWTTIRQGAAVEPCGTSSANYNASCTYGGNVNAYKLRNGQYELDPCP